MQTGVLIAQGPKKNDNGLISIGRIANYSKIELIERENGRKMN